jgi:hypothetical protein
MDHVYNQKPRNGQNWPEKAGFVNT